MLYCPLEVPSASFTGIMKMLNIMQILKTNYGSNHMSIGQNFIKEFPAITWTPSHMGISLRRGFVCQCLEAILQG